MLFHSLYCRKEWRKNRSQHLKNISWKLSINKLGSDFFTPNIFLLFIHISMIAVKLLITRSVSPRYSVYCGQVMKYKVKRKHFLNWSWQRASARIIMLTTQNKRGTLANLIYPAIKWLLSHLHELFFSEIYYFTFHDTVHRFKYEAISELWNTMYFPLQLRFKTLG